MKLATLTVILLLLLVAGHAEAERIIVGVVKGVYDGDTVLMATRESSRLKVRLYGIDAPETRKPDKPGQPYGELAKRALASKIMGRQVAAEIVDIDRYHRSVAVIRHGGRDINQEMVSEGLAWAYRRYLREPYESRYIDSENRARTRHAGLWKDANPLPPWEFRNGHGNRNRHSR